MNFFYFVKTLMKRMEIELNKFYTKKNKYTKCITTLPLLNACIT